MDAEAQQFPNGALHAPTLYARRGMDKSAASPTRGGTGALEPLGPKRVGDAPSPKGHGRTMELRVRQRTATRCGSLGGWDGDKPSTGFRASHGGCVRGGGAGAMPECLQVSYPLGHYPCDAVRDPRGEGGNPRRSDPTGLEGRRERPLGAKFVANPWASAEGCRTRFAGGTVSSRRSDLRCSPGRDLRMPHCARIRDMS
jgi:hypothetical protein